MILWTAAVGVALLGKGTAPAPNDRTESVPWHR